MNRCLTELCVLLAGTVLASAATRASATNPEQDYVLFCMGCHGEQAQGVPGRVPPLAQQLVLFMRTPQGRAYIIRVPGVSASALSDDRIASVLNWLADKFDARDFGPNIARFTTREVAAMRRPQLADAAAVRKRVIAELTSSGAAPSTSY